MFIYVFIYLYIFFLYLFFIYLFPKIINKKHNKQPRNCTQDIFTYGHKLNINIKNPRCAAKKNIQTQNASAFLFLTSVFGHKMTT